MYQLLLQAREADPVEQKRALHQMMKYFSRVLEALEVAEVTF